MPNALKVLLEELHIHSHSDFTAEYRRIAAGIDIGQKPEPPAKAQYYTWVSGSFKGLPRGYHCRVLEAMFPGWTARQLFDQASPDMHRSGPPITRPGVGLPETDTAFEAFLGGEMASRGATLVYPVFELARESRAAMETAGIPRQHQFGKPRSAFAANHRIDVPGALAENDVRGLMYVFSVLQRYTAIAVDIQADHEVVEHCDRPFISFGLSSNDTTHMYLQRTADPLFTIRDDPEHGLYLEYLELRDGTRYSSTDDVNTGIIARLRPDPVLHPDRYWIYCAGLGWRGTTGAAWYLANHWDVLHNDAGASDFVSVVKVHSYSDQTAHLEHLYVAPSDEAAA